MFSCVRQPARSVVRRTQFLRTNSPGSDGGGKEAGKEGVFSLLGSLNSMNGKVKPILEIWLIFSGTSLLCCHTGLIM